MIQYVPEEAQAEIDLHILCYTSITFQLQQVWDYLQTGKLFTTTNPRLK